MIQVPIEGDLLFRIDETSSRVAESRAEFIRGACKLRLKKIEEEELDRQYIDGYRKKPEDIAWPRAGAKLLSMILSREE